MLPPRWLTDQASNQPKDQYLSFLEAWEREVEGEEWEVDGDSAPSQYAVQYIFKLSWHQISWEREECWKRLTPCQRQTNPLFLTSPPSIHHLADDEIAQEAPFHSLEIPWPAGFALSSPPSRSSGFDSTLLTERVLFSPVRAVTVSSLGTKLTSAFLVREGALHLVRGREVMPMRGRAHSLVDSRRIALASTAVESLKVLLPNRSNRGWKRWSCFSFFSLPPFSMYSNQCHRPPFEIRWQFGVARESIMSSSGSNSRLQKQEWKRK